MRRVLQWEGESVKSWPYNQYMDGREYELFKVAHNQLKKPHDFFF